MDVAERFLNKVRKTDACWMWTASIRGSGYGAFKFKGNTHLAHRVSYELFVGVIPDGMLVCHRCDTPGCVNPEHLFLWSHHDNTVDAVKKGRVIPPNCNRFQHGEAHLMAKLSKEDVDTIRKKYSIPGNSLRSLAREYNVDHSLIWRIVRGKLWVK